MPILRVVEEVVSVIEVSYDVDVPVELCSIVGTDVAEDYLDRARDEVHRETVRVNREIVSVESIS